MWVSEPHADHEWRSCQGNGRSLYLNAEEEAEYRVGEPQTCSVYRWTETDLAVSICLWRPRPVVCCRRSKPLINKLPWLAGVVYCFIEKKPGMNFLSTACVIKLSISLSQQTQHVYSEKHLIRPFNQIYKRKKMLQNRLNNVHDWQKCNKLH